MKKGYDIHFLPSHFGWWPRRAALTTWGGVLFHRSPILRFPPCSSVTRQDQSTSHVFVVVHRWLPFSLWILSSWCSSCTLRQKVVGPLEEQTATIGRKSIHLKMCVTTATYSQVTTLMTQLQSLCTPQNTGAADLAKIILCFWEKIFAKGWALHVGLDPAQRSTVI